MAAQKWRRNKSAAIWRTAAVPPKLGIDRDSMTANIDRRPRRKKVA